MTDMTVSEALEQEEMPNGPGQLEKGVSLLTHPDPDAPYLLGGGLCIRIAGTRVIL